jgi:hypothetical protein
MTTMTGRLARRLTEALADLDDNAIRRARQERVAVQIDGGIGLSAIAAVSALPRGPRRDLEVALWAKRIVDGPRTIAFTVEDFRENDPDLDAFADLHRAVLALDGAL